MGQPGGNGKRLAAHSAQKGASPKTSQAAQRGGNSRSSTWWSEMVTGYGGLQAPSQGPSKPFKSVQDLSRTALS